MKGDKIIIEKLEKEDIEYILDNLGDMTEEEKVLMEKLLNVPITLECLMKDFEISLKLMRLKKTLMNIDVSGIQEALEMMKEE